MPTEFTSRKKFVHRRAYILIVRPLYDVPAPVLKLHLFIDFRVQFWVNNASFRIRSAHVFDGNKHQHGAKI